MARKRPQNYHKYYVEALYVGESLDLKRVQEGLKQYSFLNRDSPLVVKLLKDQYVVLTKFGSVTFWNVTERLRIQVLREIQPFVKNKKSEYPYDEDTKVFIGGCPPKGKLLKR